MTYCQCEHEKHTHEKPPHYEVPAQVEPVRTTYGTFQLCVTCANEATGCYAKPGIPQFLYDPEYECWVIRHGDITVAFYEPGHVLVSGHDVTAQVSYDQITEDRGLRFQDRNHRRANNT